MSHAERMCRGLPTWMLRCILSWPSWRNWWTAAWLELHDREVTAFAEATADEDGPWLVAPIRGIH